VKRYVVKPGAKVKLADCDPNETSAFSGDKKEAEARLQKLNGRLESLQELLYAEHKHKVLVILQAMDTGGKDGTIRKVFDRVNPQGVRVASFKAPTPLELDHDYLWRVHQQCPGRGEIVVFNRSHYEDVLVVRVHGLVPPEAWKRRYDQINGFERLLAEEGTTILKFYLHIDKDEQKERLQERLDAPEKRWKFNPGDVAERGRWDDYMKAYEDALERTSTAWAPWRIVPANRNWYRNLVVAEAIVDALEKLDMRYPEPPEGCEKIVIP
jgi:PPK2 family polyphosphate:nucleotide phosphotransferase